MLLLECPSMVEIKKRWYRLLFAPLSLMAFLLIALLSFSGGKTLSLSFDKLYIQIRELPSSDGTEQLDQINISYKGIGFKLSRKAPIIAYDSQERPMAFYPISYQNSDSDFYINLNSGAKISISAGSTDTVIRLDFPDKLKLARVELPFSVSGVKIEGSTDIPVLALNPQQDSEFFLSLSGDSSIDTNHKKLFISTAPNGKASITLGTPSGGKSVFVFWYRTQGREITERLFLSELKDYMDKAYSGFERRFEQDNLTWSYNGEKALRPETLIAYAAESIERGSYPDVQDIVTEAANTWEEEAGFFPVVYTGSLQRRTENFYSELNSKRAKIIAELKQENFDTLASFYDIFDTLVIDGSPYLIKAVQDAIDNVEPEALNDHTLAKLIQLHIKQKNSPYKILDTSAIEDIIDNYIFKSIKLIKEGLFFTDNTGKANILLSIATGAALTQEAEETGDQTLLTIARDLIVSSIKLSDRDGQLPALLDPDNNSAEGTIFPEEIYALIKPGANLPRATVITRGKDVKGWIFSLVDIKNTKVSDEEDIFEFDFPVGWIHHMVINGVAEYKRLEILKLTWRTTRLFEQYPMGAYFTPENRTLYIKYQHRDTRERVVIDYRNAEEQE